MSDNQYKGNYGGFGKGSPMSYTVDMVFCIDATASMEDTSGKEKKLINMVKENALNFYRDITKRLQEKKKQLAQLRVRVIVFRDFIADGADALMASDFFLLPQQESDFKNCIHSICAEGGGDLPEDGLEALAAAIKSDWTSHGMKKRQVIVVWTDAPTHDLGHGKGSAHYPAGMPESMAELEDWWDEMDPYAKRLILFAPNARHWDYIHENWKKVVFVDSSADRGLSDHKYDEVLEVITNSFAN